MPSQSRPANRPSRTRQALGVRNSVKDKIQHQELSLNRLGRCGYSHASGKSVMQHLGPEHADFGLLSAHLLCNTCEGAIETRPADTSWPCCGESDLDRVVGMLA